MRFFTPELYARFHSPEDAIADAAHDDWERAMEAYQCHLDSLRSHLPEPIRELANLCLHDAVLLGWESERQAFFPLLQSAGPGSALTILSLKQDRTVGSLIYVLADHFIQAPPREGWPFSRATKSWLYDEVDAVSRQDVFLHRILWSDGSVLEIPFLSALFTSVMLPETAKVDVLPPIAS